MASLFFLYPPCFVVRRQPQEISEFLIVFFALMISLRGQQQCEMKDAIVEVETSGVSGYN